MHCGGTASVPTQNGAAIAGTGKDRSKACISRWNRYVMRGAPDVASLILLSLMVAHHYALRNSNCCAIGYRGLDRAVVGAKRCSDLTHFRRQVRKDAPFTPPIGPSRLSVSTKAVDR
jgi:hypothetical protein